MSDSRLQQLKRAWEVSGTVEDEAAYLRERLRAGELTQERLDLAVYLGDEASLLVSGQAASSEVRLGEWVRGLAPWGKEVLVRAALGAARGTLAVFEATYEDKQDRRPHEACALADRWLVESSVELQDQAGNVADELQSTGFVRARYAGTYCSLTRCVASERLGILIDGLSAPQADALRTELVAAGAEAQVEPDANLPRVRRQVVLTKAATKWAHAAQALRRAGEPLFAAARAIGHGSAVDHAARAAELARTESGRPTDSRRRTRQRRSALS